MDIATGTDSFTEHELAEFFESAAIGLHWVRPDGIIIRVNRVELEMLGYSHDEYVGHHIAEFHLDQLVVNDLLNRLARGKTLNDFPARLRCKDGSVRDVLIYSSSSFDSGKFIHTRCLTMDVTGLKSQEAQARLAAIVESSDDAIVSKTLEGIVLTWNAGAEQLFGYTAAEAVGQPINLIIPPELQNEERVILERLRRGDRISHFETVRMAKDGRRISVSLTISPIRDGKGQIIGASKVARDITDRKKAEEALRSSEARLAAETAALARLNEATSRLWRMQSLEEGLQEVLAVTIDLLGADMGNVQVLDAQRRVLVIVAQQGFYREFLDFFREVSIEDDSACGRALRSGERIVVEDVETDAPYAPLRSIARSAGYRAVQSTPLIGREGAAVGMLSTHFRSVHRPSEQDLRRLDLYARQAADFIERFGTEEALRDSEQRLRLALEAGRMGTWDWNMATNSVTWSPTLEAIHGLKPGTFAGTFEAYQSDIHPEDRDRIFDSLAQSVDGSKEHHVEYRIVRPDGSMRWVEARGTPVRDGSGVPTHMIGVCTDVTERKRSDETIRSLLRISERLNSTLDVDMLLDILVQEAIELVGADAGVAGLHTPEGMVCRNYYHMGRMVPLEYCWPPMHGLPGWLIVHKVPYLTNEAMADSQIVHELCVRFGVTSALSTPILKTHGEVLGFFEVHNKEGGFTESDRETLLAISHSASIAIQNALAYRRIQLTERSARESEERFSRFMQHLPGLAWIKDLTGRYVFANDAAERAFGKPRAQLYGRTDEEIFPIATAELFRENDNRAEVSESGIQTIETLEQADGLHHSLIHKFPIPGSDGRVALVGGMAIDITERIRVEEALRESEQRYRAVVESQSEMVCRFKPDGAILFVNGAYARARDTTTEALIGRNFWEFVAEDDRPSVRAMLLGLTPDAPEVRVENRFQTNAGERWTLWTNRALTFDSAGQLLEAQSTGIDITDRKRAEQALQRANEGLRRANADLEQFAYSASHDLQEPIRNISIFSEILTRRYGHALDEAAIGHLSFITVGAQRMEMLVRDLLAYTQSAEGEEEVPEETSTTAALEKALTNLSALIGESDATVSFEMLPNLRVREVQLQQLFQNLISNAIKYRRDGEAPIIQVTAERSGPDWLFAVRDNGIGIPPEYARRVFGIFKRLHGDGKYTGTGVGLAICQRIVERNGGRIWVESDGTGRGSVFYFTLPAVERG